MNENNKYHRYAIKHELKRKQIPLNVPNLCPIIGSNHLEEITEEEFNQRTKFKQ